MTEQIKMLANSVAAIEHYISMREAMPLKGLDDCIHAIHTGTQYGAELTFTDIKAIVAALRASPPIAGSGREWPSLEVVAREIRRAMLDNPTDASFNKRAEQREAIANEVAGVIMARFAASLPPSPEAGSERSAAIEECARMLEESYPDNANTNAFCAAIRSLRALSPPIGTAPVAWRKTAETALQEVIMAIAFLSRDVGTDRINATAGSIATRLTKVDAELRATLASPGQSVGLAHSRPHQSGGEA